MKLKKLVGRYARLNVETMFFRKPGLMQITRADYIAADKDYSCLAVEMATGATIGPFMRSECSILREKLPVSSDDVECRQYRIAVKQMAVRQCASHRFATFLRVCPTYCTPVAVCVMT